jgi:large subunit ribosomal protein L30
MARTRNKTAKPQAAAGAMIHLKYVRSMNCCPVKHRLVVKGLGFTRLAKVPHLVVIVKAAK